jgi:spermidine synthase
LAHVLPPEFRTPGDGGYSAAVLPSLSLVDRRVEWELAVQPMRIVDSVVTLDGRELVLYRRGEAFFLRVDTEDLMSSRMHGSEEEMAHLAVDAIIANDAPRVLVGGLGMGFTLRATLDALAGRDRARVVVAEVFDAVVRWNFGVLGHLAGRPLDDPRVEVEAVDVAQVVDHPAKPFDAILLDVDNGPDAFTLDDNRYLYTYDGLARLHRAVAPGGVLAVWSAYDAPPFTQRLQRSGFEVTVHRAFERPGSKRRRHVIFVARRLDVEVPIRRQRFS